MASASDVFSSDMMTPSDASSDTGIPTPSEGSSSGSGTSTEFPSYETLRQAGTFVRTSTEMLRLHWYLRDSIDESIKVLDDATNADSRQQSYQTVDGGAVRLHAVSTASYTEPPVSAIRPALSPSSHSTLIWGSSLVGVSRKARELSRIKLR